MRRSALRESHGAPPVPLRARRVSHSLYCRPGTSDFDVFEQVFVNLDYSPVAHLQGVGLIVDCGAYVGFSSAYFLAQFPDSRVIAVEPDPENIILLRRNLAPFGHRVRICEAAVWSGVEGLRISDEKYRDGRHWARGVRNCSGGEAQTIQGLDLRTLLERYDERSISILKMDIEGAEALVFRSEPERWLDRVETIIVELHDDSPFGDASAAFARACSHQFDLSQRGHVMLATRQR
jgi:FkbM family methyltransferase